jgi:O-antigen/teichoic acid export membrane protein
MTVFGLPLTVAQLASWALRRIDRFQIQAVYGAAAVGAYTVPYLVAQHSILLFAITLGTTSFPLAADAWERQGHAAGLRMLEAVTRMYLLAMIPALAGISVLARPVLQLMGGADFSQGFGIIPWVAGGVFCFGLQQRFANVLLLAERTGVVMASTTVAAVANIVLNWWLLPSHGYQIAAVTTFVSYALLTALLALACWRHMRWSLPWRSALRALLSAAGMVVVVQLLRLQLTMMSPLIDLAVSVPVGVLTYGALLHLSGESTFSEWKAVWTAALGRLALPRDAQ